MKSEKGKLIVVSGFSGVGKGTVIRRVMDAHPEFAFSVSATTRAPREGETDGVEYFFISKEEFEAGIAAGRFLEHARYSDQYYGTPADEVSRRLDQGIHVVLDIEYQGAFQVKEHCPDALMIFLIPPDAQTLVSRLTNRGTEDAEKIRKRLTQALTEADQAPRYSCILVNDNLEKTVEDFLGVVENPERAGGFYRENVGKISRIKEDLAEILTKN